MRNGLIGNVTHVEVGLPGGHHDFPGTVPALMQKLASLPDKIAEPRRRSCPERRHGTWPSPSRRPSSITTRWIGPSKMEPYIEARVYQNWRWNYNTGGGQLLDWIGHHGDIAHWGLGFDLHRPVGDRRPRRVSGRQRGVEHGHQIHVECTYRKEVTRLSRRRDA